MTRITTYLLAAIMAVSTLAMGQTRNYVGGKNKIRYDQFEWQVYETAHFRISYYDRVEPNLERLASFAESSYDELARRLNFQILEPINMLAYASHAEFEQSNVIVSFIPEGVGAFATPVRNRMVLPVDLSDRALQELIQHELTHIFQYEILFQGRRGRAIYRRPPLWFMEGMASYFADDEDARAEAYMRDAALSDRVPSIAQPVRGYYAYRFGHKVFQYIGEEWGEDGLRDFIFAFRNTMGGRIDRPLQRVFHMDPDEFDAAFRAWLRKHYSEYDDRQTSREFGRRFRAERTYPSQEVSPVASPSGDLVAAFTTYKDDIDVAIFGVPDRYRYRNLTKGYTSAYEYLIAQHLTVGGDRGRDLAFSPNGNQVAVFARSERSRSLLLLDAVKGGIDRTIEIPLPIDQAAEPAWSPDGRSIAFRAVEYGRHDIYIIDLESGDIRNVTDDEAYDAAPTFAPGGRRLVYTAQSGEIGKLVELTLDGSSDRRQLTFGPGTDEGAAFSLDGKRLYFASDRDQGVLDIYMLDLEVGDLHRLTRVIGAAVNPTPVQTLEGERVIFQGFGGGRWNLYEIDPNLAENLGPAEAPKLGVDLDRYLPAMSMTIDPSKSKPDTSRKLFLEDANIIVGVDQDGNFLSQSLIVMSDQYGDQRFTALLSSIDTFSNFRISWLNMKNRLQWGVYLYDNRQYYIFGYDPVRERFTEREQTYRQTGLAMIGQYPLSRHYRLDGSVGYLDREIDYIAPQEDGSTGVVTVKDSIPMVSLGVTGDTVLWRRYGPHQGSRWNFRVLYGYDIDNGGTLTRNYEFDGRKYLHLSRRNELALRLFLGYAEGTSPSLFYFGGLDNLRGFKTYSLAGNRAGFANIEWRFPLIDRLDMPFMTIGDVRGRFFVDIGAAWYDFNGVEYNYLGDEGFTFMEDGRLVDGVSSYGFGFSATLLGMPMHWDFVKRWDFKDTLSSTETSFWIGYRF